MTNHIRKIMSEKPIFVTAAEIAAELSKSMYIAKRLLLVASNARALASRAGEGAAGFKPITDSIDELVSVTLSSSKTINSKAKTLSDIATKSIRSAYLLEKFERVYSTTNNGRYIHSLDDVLSKNKAEHQKLVLQFKLEAKSLFEILEELSVKLRIAHIISIMLSVEASQADEKFQAQLNSIADSVTELAQSIQSHVNQSLTHFSSIPKVENALTSTL